MKGYKVSHNWEVIYSLMLTLYHIIHIYSI